MNTGMKFITVASAWLLASGPTVAQEPAAQAGKALFERYNCWFCHGREGQGTGSPGASSFGGTYGPRIAPTAYPYEAFRVFVRTGNEMPAYSPKALKEEDLRKIYEYIRSISEPPAVNATPLLMNFMNKK